MEGLASIGPRVLTRGNIDAVFIGGSTEWLQLGHAFSRVETGCSDAHWVLSDVLQLGHAFSRVETGDALRGNTGIPYASIGPRVLTRGNVHPKGVWSSRSLGFNWATRSHAWKLTNTLIPTT